MTQYQTKRQRISKYIQNSIRDVKAMEKEDVPKKIFIASCALDLGVSEENVLDVLATMENANILKVNGEKIYLY